MGKHQVEGELAIVSFSQYSMQWLPPWLLVTVFGSYCGQAKKKKTLEWLLVKPENIEIICWLHLINVVLFAYFIIFAYFINLTFCLLIFKSWPIS
jgi:hypothetical protein